MNTKYLVLDNVVSAGLVNAALATWPEPTWPHWYRYDQHGTKYASKDVLRLPDACRKLIDRILDLHPASLLNLPDTGLFPDLDLHGAGMHWIPTGGWLDRHVDGAVHPLTGWRRRANTILYLEECTGGQLCVSGKEIDPFPGRIVIFETHDQAYHEVKPVTAGNRRSLSLFWWDHGFTDSTRTTAQFVP